MDCMFDTLRKHDALVKAFSEEKTEVVKRLIRQIEEEKGRNAATESITSERGHCGVCAATREPLC